MSSRSVLSHVTTESDLEVEEQYEHKTLAVGFTKPSLLRTRKRHGFTLDYYVPIDYRAEVLVDGRWFVAETAEKNERPVFRIFRRDATPRERISQGAWCNSFVAACRVHLPPRQTRYDALSVFGFASPEVQAALQSNHSSLRQLPTLDQQRQMQQGGGGAGQATGGGAPAAGGGAIQPTVQDSGALSDRETMELKDALRKQLDSSSSSLSKDALGTLSGILTQVMTRLTQGADMSGLFVEMAMIASRTTMINHRKLIYRYLCHYAPLVSASSLLAVNTLLLASRGMDPVHRALAIKSLCSLGVPGLAEYGVTTVSKSIEDAVPYVRKVSAMGIAQLYAITPKQVQDAKLVDKLRMRLTMDTDAAVVLAALQALVDIHERMGDPFQVTKALLFPLLQKLAIFDEWGQARLISMLAEYTPESEDETFEIMSFLDDRLDHANSAVVLETASVFLRVASSIPDVYDSVLERLRAPLIRLVSGRSNETAYTALCHIRLLARRRPDVFAQDYTRFFLSMHDPSYVKNEKLEIMALLASDSSGVPILTELTECVSDVDVNAAAKAVSCIGKVAVACGQDIATECYATLCQFLSYSTDFVRDQALEVLAQVLRKYPSLCGTSSVQQIASVLPQVTTPSARVAAVWILGEFGYILPDAAYTFEAIVESLDKEDDAVILQLLRSLPKLFFLEPAQCKPALGSLLMYTTSENRGVDVHDEALFVTRLLMANVQTAQQILGHHSQSGRMTGGGGFVEDSQDGLLDQLLEEFNTLSVLIGKPYAMWMRDPTEDEDEDDEAAPPEAAPEAAPAAVQEVAQPQQQQGQAQEVDLLGGDDGGELEEVYDVPELILTPTVLSTSDFQAKWGAHPAAIDFTATATASFGDVQLVQLLAPMGVQCVARGALPTGGCKWFLYGQVEDPMCSGFVLAEVRLSPTLQLTASVRHAGDGDHMTAAEALWVVLEEVCCE